MKKIYLFAIAFLFATNFSYAQWLPSGATSGPIYYNNGNVGVGTVSPITNLDISYTSTLTDPLAFTNTASGGGRWILTDGGGGASAGKFAIINSNVTTIPRFIIDKTGNVGIGTTSPGAKLEISTGGGGIASDGLKIFHSANSGYSVLNVHSEYGNGGGGSLASVSNFDGTKFLIDNSGNVGIGTASPDEKLTVNGTVHSTEVKVTVGPLADYVFNADYHLPTLSEVKTYVDKNHHLPDVPSAAEVEKNGLKLGEMNATLLKKVEELTLYLIEKDKQLKKEEEINRQQELRLKKVEAKLKVNHKN